MDPHKQRMLEGIAWEVEKARQAILQEEADAKAAASASSKHKGGNRGGKGSSKAQLLSASSSPSARVGSAASALSLLVPSKKPALVTYRLRPGRSLFLAGLARIDWVHPLDNCHILLTLAHAPGLQLHATSTLKADDLLRRALTIDASGTPNSGVEPRAAVGGGGAVVNTGADGASVDPTSDLGSADAIAGAARILWPRWGPLVHTSRVPLAASTTVDQYAMIEEGLKLDGIDINTVDSSINDNIDAAGSAAVSSGANADPSSATGGGHADLHHRNDHQQARRLPPAALIPGASKSATDQRRRSRIRKAIADVVFSGLGWVSVCPVEVEGQVGWARTVGLGSLRVHTALGVHVALRSPLLPYQASDTQPSEWKE